MTTGEEIVKEARTWKDVPWRHQGRDRLGVDCAGLIIAVARATGLDRLCGYIDSRDYPMQPTNDRMMQLLRKYTDHVRGGSKLEAGYILHFAFKNKKMPQHVAIYTGEDNRIIHAYNSGRKIVIETGYTGKWPRRIHSVYKYRGVS